MNEVIQCNSCGSSNQLPEGRNSMFCAFCGNAIERKIVNHPTSIISFPTIISEVKKEMPFKRMQWYKDKLMTIEVQKRMFLGSPTYKVIDNIEHFRVNDGYNVIVTWSKKNFKDDYPREEKETEFLPLEYDYDSSVSKLNLSSMNIKSFEEIQSHYDLKDLNEVTELNLDNNQIVKWDGLEVFKRLKSLSIKNNLLEEFPSELPTNIYENDSKFNLADVVIRKLDLSNNRIKTIGLIVPKFPHSNHEIILTGNPLNLSLIPDKVQSFFLYNNGNKVFWSYNLIIDSDFRLKFDFIPPKIKNVEVNIESNSNEKSSGKCFIATATMGSYDHPEVMELRGFRDDWILKQSWGQNFVKWYYHYGEKLAKVIEQSFVLKKISYWVIVKPLVKFSKFFNK